MEKNIDVRARTWLNKSKSDWNRRYDGTVSRLNSWCVVNLGQNLRALETHLLFLMIFPGMGLFTAITLWEIKQVADLDIKLRVVFYPLLFVAVILLADIWIWIFVAMSELYGLYGPLFWGYRQKDNIKAFIRQIKQNVQNAKWPRRLWC